MHLITKFNNTFQDQALLQVRAYSHTSERAGDALTMPTSPTAVATSMLQQRGVQSRTEACEVLVR